MKFIHLACLFMQYTSSILKFIALADAFSLPSTGTEITHASSHSHSKHKDSVVQEYHPGKATESLHNSTYLKLDSFDQHFGSNSRRKKPLADFGIVLIIYCVDINICKELYSLASRCAASFREQNPNLPIALISSYETSLLIKRVHFAFDYEIPIPSSMIYAYTGKQWLTRILALTLSPFQLTLEVDSDTICCSPVSSYLEEVYRKNLGKVDFAVLQHNQTIGSLQNAVLLYNKSECFYGLLRSWYHEQVHLQLKTNITDDQSTLRTAIKSLQHKKTIRDCSIRYLSPVMNYGFDWRLPLDPANDRGWIWDQNLYYSSPVLKTSVAIMHGRGLFKFKKEICTLVNSEQHRPRLLTYYNLGPPKYENRKRRFEGYNVSYSLEDCHKQLNGHCPSGLSFTRYRSAECSALFC